MQCVAFASAALPARAASRRAAEPLATDPRLAALPAVIGEPSSDIVESADDTVLDITYRHRLGFDRVARMNPQHQERLDPGPGHGGRPAHRAHPARDRRWRGLVINVPEMQLYDFTVKNDLGEPEVFSIAIGDEVDPSLMGDFKVGSKRAQPSWHVPKSIQAERPGLPTVVPPGPDNPLGPYWMTIGNTSYGIHGSNNEWSIGRQATHGCIRLYNDQIERLFLRTRETDAAPADLPDREGRPARQHDLHRVAPRSSTARIPRASRSRSNACAPSTCSSTSTRSRCTARSRSSAARPSRSARSRRSRRVPPGLRHHPTP